MSNPWHWAEWKTNRHGEQWQEIDLPNQDETVRRYINPQGGYFFRNRHGQPITADRAEMLLNFQPRRLPDDVPASPYRLHEPTTQPGTNYPYRSSRESSTRPSHGNDYNMIDEESPAIPPPRISRELPPQRLPAIREPMLDDQDSYATQGNIQMHEATRPYAGSSRRSFGRSESFNQGRYNRDSSIVTIQEADGYRIERSHFFEPGRVLQTLLYEPCGENPNQPGPQEPTSQSRQTPYETRRPMVVVRRYAAHCLCVPIYTHRQKGAKKPNLARSEAEQHAVICDQSKVPFCDEEEIRKGMPSPETLNIAVRMVGRQSLSRWSRVRFDSICIVRYNWKVLDIGTVTDVGLLLGCVRKSLFPA